MRMHPTFVDAYFVESAMRVILAATCFQFATQAVKGTQFTVVVYFSDPTRTLTNIYWWCESMGDD